MMPDDVRLAFEEFIAALRNNPFESSRAMVHETANRIEAALRKASETEDDTKLTDALNATAAMMAAVGQSFSEWWEYTGGPAARKMAAAAHRWEEQRRCNWSASRCVDGEC